MRSKANTDFDLSPPEQPCRAGERTCRADMSKLVLEGMMTVFIVLIFLFIAQNWVLTNADDTPFMPTCSLPDGKVGIVGHVYETNNIINDYNLRKFRIDNM